MRNDFRRSFLSAVALPTAAVLLVINLAAPGAQALGIGRRTGYGRSIDRPTLIAHRREAAGSHRLGPMAGVFPTDRSPLKSKTLSGSGRRPYSAAGPVKLGARFSRNEATPSRTSGPPKPSVS